jgi:hypothetical protein
VAPGDAWHRDQRALSGVGFHVHYLNVTVAGSRGQPTGALHVLEGAILLNSLTLVNGGASFNYMSSTSGVHQITVQYSGDSNYTPLSWTFPVTVLVPSTVNLAADANPANRAPVSRSPGRYRRRRPPDELPSTTADHF